MAVIGKRAEFGIKSSFTHAPLPKTRRTFGLLPLRWGMTLLYGDGRIHKQILVNLIPFFLQPLLQILRSLPKQ